MRKIPLLATVASILSIIHGPANDVVKVYRAPTPASMRSYRGQPHPQKGWRATASRRRHQEIAARQRRNRRMARA
jgi:hypothetical protein